MQFAMIKLQLR